MRAVTAHDHQRRRDLFRPLHNHLERLADEDLRLERHVGELLRHHLGPLQVRLAELEQPLVDDVVVQLFLLLELEDLRCLIRQDVLDIVEDDVVILDVEGAADEERAAKLPGQLERRLHRLVAVGDRKSTRLNSSHGYISYAVFCLKKKYFSAADLDRKSTRLNSSHGYISYAVFCLKKKNKKLRMNERHLTTTMSTTIVMTGKQSRS